MTDYGDASPSLEVCGVLLGTKTSDTEWLCDEFVPVTNVSPMPPVHYIPHPNEFLNVLKRTTHFSDDAEKDLIGIFHTHPNNVARPSIIDITEASYLGAYIIYSPRLKEMNTFYSDGEIPAWTPIIRKDI
jgi:proteasome lid subunit RPN8/RPN11